MPVLAISISEKGRSCLAATLLLMNLSIAIINFITIIMGIALAVLFNQQRDMLKEFNYKKLNFLIIFSGLALLGFHLFGAKLSFDCANPATRGRFKRLLLIFIGLTLVALVLLMVVSISTSAAIYQLTKGYEKGFTELMEAYDADKSKRMEVDMLQVSNKCCGSKGYKDWIDMAWYPDEFMRPERKGRGVPFTCCDPEYMGPCLHDAGDNARPGYKKAGDKSFYADGCAEVITVTLRWLLNKISLWLILPIWLELFIMAGTKYLMTSINSAENAGDELGPGHGFLMEKCPCSCMEFLECDVTSKIKKKKGRD